MTATPATPATPDGLDALRELSVADLKRLAGRDRAVRPLASVERLSPQAAAIWAAHELTHGATYSIVHRWHLRGALDEEALRVALLAVAHRHVALRRGVRLTATGPMWTLWPDAVVAARLLSVAEAGAGATAEEFAARPFALDREPPCRFLLRRGASEWELTAVFHHIAFDGASTPVFLDDVHRAYALARKGLTADEVVTELGAAPDPEALAAARRAERGDGGAEYWRRTLSGAAPLSWPRQGGGRPRTASFPFTPNQARALRERARDLATTPFTVFLAAVGRALAIRNDRQDAVVQVLNSGRWDSASASVVGCLTYAHPVRVPPGGTDAATCADLTAQVVAAETHAEFVQTGMLDLVRELTGAEHGNPFDTVAVTGGHDTEAEPALRLGDVVCTRVRTTPVGAAHQALALELRGSAGGAWQVGVQWDDAAADESEIDDLVAEIVAAAAGEPRRGRARGPGSLPPLADWPVAGGVVTADGRLAVAADLRARAARAAGWLQATGIGREDVVAIRVAAPMLMLPLVLGTLRAGAAFLLLDPEWPAEHASWVVADAGAAVVITDDAATTPSGGWRVAQAHEVFLGPVLETADEDPDRLAYLMYTSGSTGRPKGVQVTYGSLVRYLSWAVRHFGIEPGAAVPLFTSVTADLTITSLLGPIAVGALVHAVSARPALALSAALARPKSYAMVKATPSHLKMAVAHGLDEVRATIGTLVVGGEALLYEDLKAWRARLPGLRIVNEYGPTEATVACTAYEAAATGAGPVPIGSPIAPNRVHVLDAAGREVPEGGTGEVYVGGPQLARGYHGHPARTAEMFVPDPFGPPGGRLYRTGDLARRLPGGDLEYLGRADRQVKVGGRRIEPGEVETALRRHPGVRQAAVTAHQGRLVAFVVAEDGDVTGAAVRSWLRDRVPAHLVPGTVRVVADIPLGRSGKTDFAVLLAEPKSRPRAADRETETALVLRAMREVLDRPGLASTEDFFAAGGDSLAAARVVGTLTEAGFPVRLRDVFDEPTAAGLARRLGARRPAPAADATPATGDDAVVPLSVVQQQFWLDQLRHPGSAVYHVPITLAVDQDVDVARLARAWEAVQRAHPVLRTELVATEGPLPAQRVRAEPVSRLGAGVETDDLDAAVGQFVATPFDLVGGPLVRARLLVSPAGRRVVVVLHHIISDAGVVAAVVRDLNRAHAEPECLEPVRAARYLDAVTRATTSDDAYWDDRLRGATLATVAPDSPGSVAFPDAGPVRAELGAADLRALLAFAKGSRRTPHTVLAAVLAAVLAVRSGRQDVTMLVTSADRAAGDDVVGCFTRTLPVRVAVDPAASLFELVAGAEAAVLDAVEHGGSALADMLRPVRRVDGHRAAGTMLVVEDLRDRGPDGGVCTPVAGPIAATSLDMVLTCELGRDALACTLQYDPARYSRTTVERVHAQFLAALRSAVRMPMEPLAEVCGISQDERAALDAVAVAPPRDAVSATSLHGAIVRHAVAHAEKKAVVEPGGTTLSYAELVAAATVLARTLGPGAEPVAVVGAPGAGVVVGVLAALIAGHPFLPIDPRTPQSRRERIVARSGAVTTMTVTGSRIEVTGGSGQAGTVTITDLLAAGPAGPVPQDADPAASAYVIYTSGSTGTPKGVLVSHGCALGLAAAWARGHRLDPGGMTWLSLASTGFDVFVGNLVRTLCLGGTLVVAQPEVASTPAELLRVVTEHDVQAFESPAPALVEHLVALAAERGWPGTLELLVVATDGRAQTWRELRTRLPRGVRLLNIYGVTEATVDSTVHEPAEDPFDALRTRLPIGRPLPGVRCYVLDAAGERVPFGGDGELWLGGDGLADGYHGDPALTAQRFTPDPMGGAGARMYRTGDHVRLLWDGCLEFLGRLDQQLRVRGHRVEPAEVEAELTAHPRVGAACVTADTDATGEVRLAAWLEADEPVDAHEVRTWLATRLPAYMCPAAVAVLPRLPLTVNGKIDRARLTADAAALFEDERPRTGAPPGTDVEKAVARVWADLLGREVFRDDDFFGLGGHSLMAMRMAWEVGRELTVDIPPQLVFGGATLAAFAAAVEDVRRARAGADAEVVRTDAEELPLYAAQRRLWYGRLTAENPSGYHIALAWSTGEPLDVDRLRRVLDTLTAHHEVLRVRIRDTADGPRQRVLRSGGRAAVVHEVVDTSDAADEAVLPTLVDLPFDLATDPAFRCHVVRRAGGRSLLLTVFHHIAFDQHAVELFIADLRTAWAGGALGEPAGYLDHLAQEDRAAAAVRDADAAFWQDLLADPQPSTLSTGVLSPAGPARTAVLLDDSLASAVRAVASSAGATVSEVLLTGLAVAVATFTARAEVTVGAAVHGRNRAAAADVVGNFVNPVVLRTTVARQGTFRDLLGRTRDAWRSVLAHQRMSFDDVVRVAGVSGGPGFGLFGISYDHSGPAGGAPVTGPLDIAMTGIDLDGDTPLAELDLRTAEVGAGIRLSAVRRVDRVPGETVDALLGYWRDVLAAGCARPDAGSWRDDVVPAASATVRGPRTGPAEPLAELLARAALAHPDRPAVRHGDVALTYAGLTSRVRAAADVLSGLGLRAGDRVAVVAESSLDTVLAVLAVAWAGMTYVPVDPGYPADRVALMLRLARAHAVVADRPVPVPDTLSIGLADLAAAPPVSSATGPVPAADAAYLVFTSGSTGVPKPVEVTSHGIANTALAQRESFGLASGDVVAQLASFSFDAWSFELLLAVGAGACLDVPATRGLAGPLLTGFLARRGITAAVVVPSALSGAVPVELPALRLIVFAGEQCGAALVSDWSAPGRDVVNAYGPTEAAIWATAHTCRDGEAVPPIGRPIAGTGAYVLDASARPVPPGAQGELFLAGAGVANGYFGMPARTAEKFLPDPFAPAAGARMYATGDRVRLDAAGRLHFLGRTDDQVKVRGHRVEMAEVERAASRVPGVRSAVAVTLDGALGGAVLALAVTGDAEPESVRAGLADVLPPWSVPDVVRRFDELPRTPGGKVDRAAARRLLAERNQARELPSTEAERLAAAVWGRVLGFDEVGVTDDFFALGGHSIAAARMAHELTELFAVPVTVAAVLAHRTIRGLLTELGRTGPEQTAFDLRAARAGTGVPVVLVSGVSGDTAVYRQLVHHLCAARWDAAVWTLAVPDWRAASTAAAAAVAALGPRVVLVGWSAGAAFAAALVAHLAGLGVAADLVSVDGLPELAAGELRALSEELASPSATASAAAALGVAPEALADLPAAALAAMTDRWRANLDALAELARPAAGPAHLLVVAAADGDLVDAATAWRGVPHGRLDVVTVRGDHFSIMRGDAAEHVADAVRDHLVDWMDDDESD